MSSSVDRFLQRSGSVDAPQPALPFTLEHAPDPDRAARILRAQQATGLSGDIVARQLEQIEAAEKAKQLQQHQLAPVTKAFVAEDPNQAAIAQKEAPQLSYLERHIRHAAQEFSGGRATTRLTDIGTAAMLGKATEEQRAEQAAIEAELGNHVDYGIGQGLRPTMFSRGPEGDAMYDAVKRSSPAFGAIATALELLEQVPGAVANQVPIMASTFKGKAIGAGVGFAGGAAVGAVTGPGALATGTAGAGLGWRLGGVPAAAQMEAATAYLDYEKLRDDQGRPLDRKLILGAAIVTGAVNGALEGLSLDKLTKSIPGIRTLGRKGMRELLAKQTTRMAVEHALKELGESAITEGTTEFLQEYVTNLSGRIVQLAQGDKQLSVGELLEQTVGDPQFFAGALEAGKGGLLAAVGGSALGGATSIATKAVQVRRAERQADVFRVLAEGAANSELRATLPEKHRELVDRMTKHGPLESVYVPAERFTEYFQGAGLDPADVATELLGSRERYDEAQRSGGLLEIPTSTYATMLAGTDHHKGLVEDLSFSPTELSLREAKQQAAELDAEIEARQKMDRGGLEAAELVTDHVTDQLRRAGFNEKTARTYASALYGAPMRTLASRLGTGVTADELLTRFNLRISRPGTEGAPQLPAVDVERIRVAHEATRAAALERSGKVLEEGEERFMAPRAPGGGRRPVERVSTKGLLTELLDLEEKRADAENRSVYEVRDDPNFHTDGIPQVAATRKGKEPSRQAKALTNLDDFKRISDQVFGELARRGLDERSVFDAIEDLRAELDERAAQAGDFDALGRGEQITDEAGNVLFQPAPGPIDSPAFRAWFGDSKVVNPDGSPRVVYHGTGNTEGILAEGFSRRLLGYGNDQYGSGFYFTTDQNQAKAYERSRLEPDLEKLGGESSPGTLEVYLALQKPIVLDGEHHANMRDAVGAVSKRQIAKILMMAPDIRDPDGPLSNWGDVSYEGFKAVFDRAVEAYADNVFTIGNDFFPGAAGEFNHAIRSVLGYDGVRIDFPNGQSHFVAWFPEQIKSATANVGTFRPDSPNILEQSAEEFARMVKDPTRWYRDQLEAALTRGWDPSEEIVAAAVRHPNGVIGFGPTHYFALNERGYDELPEHELAQLEEGFLTSTGRFVGREEADAILMGPEETRDQIAELAANRELDYSVLHTGDLGELPGYGGRQSGTIVPGESKTRAHPRRRRTLEQRAYHGSPYRFDAFSLAHMGKGEGAQAYGWGLYFAGEKEVAEYYRHGLSGNEVHFAGQLVAHVQGNSMRWTSEAYDQLTSSMRKAIDYAQAHNGDLERAIQGVQNNIDFNRSYAPEMAALEEHTLTALRTLKPGDVEIKAGGRLYTVEIPGDEQLLAWDRPLSQQSARVQAALEQLGIHVGTIKYPTYQQAINLFGGDFAQRGATEDIGIRRTLTVGFQLLGKWREEQITGLDDGPGKKAWQHWFAQSGKLLSPTRHNDITGEDAVRELTVRLYNERKIPWSDAPEAASRALREVGILGHKYLNGMSRNSGDGGYNFVVYDDAAIDIREYEQRAFHGSPHEFDRFSLQHVGTGEGAQVYGWGLYFAGKKEVAQWYRDRLSDGGQLAPSELHALPSGVTVQQFLEDARNTIEDKEGYSIGNVAMARAATALIDAHRQLEQAIADKEDVSDVALVDIAERIVSEKRDNNTRFYRETVQQLVDAIDRQTANGVAVRSTDLQALAEAREKIRREEKLADNAHDLLDQFRPELGLAELLTEIQVSKGRLFTVELSPEDHEWLDWDKTMREQSDHVLDRLGEVAYEDHVTLGDFVSDLDALASIGYDYRRGVPRDLPWQVRHWVDSFRHGLVQFRDAQQALDRTRRLVAELPDEARAHAEAYAAVEEFFTRAQEAINAGGWQVRIEREYAPHLTGEDAYHVITEREGSPQRASEWLRKQGVRGIRYLDGSSRGRGAGDHNFVIFDENDVAVREYEQAVEQGPPADPESTLFLEKLIGEHDVGVLVKLAPLLKGNEIARAGTVRQFYDELVQLVAMGAFDEQLGDTDPIDSPAVRVGQALYRGRSIADATRQVIETTGRSSSTAAAPGRSDRIEEGFATKGNQFLTRDQALARSQLRVDPHAGVAKLLEQLGITEIRLGQMPVDMREYEQRAPAQKRTLIVQHNITSEKLMNAVAVGGLAMPSIAITHGDHAMSGFGEITLLGDQALIDPRKSSKTRVFGADIYSPRYPETEHSVNYKQLAKLSKELEAWNLGDDRLRTEVDQLESRGREQLEFRADVRAAFLQSKGLSTDPRDWLEGRIDRAEIERKGTLGKWDNFYIFRDAILRSGLQEEFEQYAGELWERLEPKQRIRNGWDANGNPRYIAHTLANVMRKMRREGRLRGGETAGNSFGAGQVRSHYAPEFRSVTEIRDAAAAGRIVTDEQFEDVRKEIDNEFLALASELEEFSDRSRDFQWMDVVSGLLEDASTKGIDAALREWQFDPIDEDRRQAIADFQEKLRNLPTEYFEAKLLRAVDPGEFKAAVIPHTTPLRVRELLRERGLQIAEYKMGDMADRKRVIEQTAQQHDLLFQKPSDPRGRIRIGNNSMEIELLEKANLSTFIHETGHFYLEVLGTLAGDDDPPAQIRADYNTLLSWLGVSSRAELETKHHEQFARAFEAYLLEGESPSEELRGPFARLRTWLVSVYRSVKALRVELTPEVRQVFDRLFATDEEIAAAEQRVRAEPLFADVAAAGMSPGLAEHYSRVIADARMAARDELATKAMAELARERKAWWKEERERMRDRVALEVYAEPTSRALAMLQKGTLPDGSPLPEGVAAVKLDKALLVDAYGPELVKALPRGLYAKEGGLSADDAATVFGFGTGGELLQALSSSEKIPARIDRLTDERMREEHGNMLEDGTLADRAMAAVHNEDRGRVLRLELEHLLSNDLAAAKGMLRKLGRRIPSTSDSRELARATIAAKQIRDIQPQLYQVAEAKAAGLAIDHFTKGDVEGAFTEKLRELHNYELYRAATAAKESADKIVELMRSFDRPAVRQRIGKAGGGYLEQIDALRERYSFTRIGERGLRKREKLREFAARAAAEGTEIDVPEQLLEEAGRQHWKETTLEELEGLRDTVEQLAHLARTKNRLLANEAKRNLEDARAELRAGAAEHFNLERDPVDLTKPLREQLVSTGKGIVADHTRMEFLFQRLDGFKARGPFWTYFFQPFARAEDLENTMRRADAEAMKQILSPYTAAERRAWFTKRIDLPAAGTSRVRGTFTKANVLAIALNWGNDYNRAALMEGYGWNESQVEKILDTLDERDWKFVQSIWSHIDTYWPAAEQLEKEITGLAPAKVEASPVTTRFGTFAGGYYPIAFDREQSSRQTALDLAASVSDMAKGYGARAMTRHGHLIERTSTGGKPLLLELSVINQHLAQVTHDLSHRRAVIDASKLIRDPEIQATIEASVGKEMYQQLGPWLSSIAGDVPTNMVQRLERVAARARMGATAVGLGLNITSSFVQTLGYANTLAELGPEYSAKGLADAYGKPWQLARTWAFVTSRSSSMRDRLGNFDREVRDLARKPGALGTLGVDPSFMYQLIGWMDMGVSIPSWLGAYRKAMDGKAEGITAGDERAAIDFADALVRTTQAAGAAKDLAAVQRGPQWWKLNTAFYSSMSILFNQFARIPQRYAIDKDPAKVLASVVLIWFLPAVMEDLLRGRGPQPDDDKLKWAGKKIAFYPLSTVVLLRDLASSLERSLEYGRLEAPTTAISQIIESTGKTAKAAIDLAGGAELKRAQLREAFNTVGYYAQLPTRQLWKTGEYFHDWWTGTTSPDSPLEAFWGAVTGVPQDDRQR